MIPLKTENSGNFNLQKKLRNPAFIKYKENCNCKKLPLLSALCCSMERTHLLAIEVDFTWCSWTDEFSLNLHLTRNLQRHIYI